MFTRDILYLNVSSFRIEVERVGAPRLRERPVAVALPHSSRSPLLEVSREARAEGISEGMTLGVALRICRGLTVISPNPGLYEKASSALGMLVAQFTPLWEPHAPGHIFLDMSGSRRLFGPPRDVAWRVEKELERGMTMRASLGIAANKLVSRIAARTVPPRRIIDVERGNEASFIAPLSVRLLPGVGDARVRTLFDDLNVKLIGEIATISLPHLRMIFGAFAIVLHQRALGLDLDPVRPPVRRPASADEITLAEDTNDDRVLLGHLYSLVEQIAARMRTAELRAGDATLTVRYSDGVETTRRADLPIPSFQDFDLYAVIEKLYFKANERRTRVRHMKVSFAHAEKRPRQLDLDFDEESDDVSVRHSGLLEALDRIRGKHGYAAVRFGRVPPGAVKKKEAIADAEGQRCRGAEVKVVPATPPLLGSSAPPLQLPFQVSLLQQAPRERSPLSSEMRSLCA